MAASIIAAFERQPQWVWTVTGIVLQVLPWTLVMGRAVTYTGTDELGFQDFSLVVLAVAAVVVMDGRAFLVLYALYASLFTIFLPVLSRSPVALSGCPGLPLVFDGVGDNDISVLGFLQSAHSTGILVVFLVPAMLINLSQIEAGVWTQLGPSGASDHRFQTLGCPTVRIFTRVSELLLWTWLTLGS
jgi:hypothetical protein